MTNKEQTEMIKYARQESAMLRACGYRREWIDQQGVECITSTTHAADTIDVLCDEIERLRAENEEHEAAVFAKGYRKGYWNGSGDNVTPFQSEVDNAYDNWVRVGKRTHLTMEDK